MNHQSAILVTGGAGNAAGADARGDIGELREKESRAGAKSPALNVDAPTQRAVYLTSLCLGKC